MLATACPNGRLWNWLSLHPGNTLQNDNSCWVWLAELCIWGTEIKFEIKNYSLLNFFSVLYFPFFICSLFYIPYGFYRLLHQLQAKFSWANKSRVNLRLSPRGGLFILSPFEGGLSVIVWESVPGAKSCGQPIWLKLGTEVGCDQIFQKPLWLTSLTFSFEVAGGVSFFAL